MKELSNVMNKIVNNVNKSFDKDMKDRRHNWKLALKGELPLLISFTDCKNESMRYKVLPINEVKLWLHDGKELYSFYSTSFNMNQISQDVTGQLAKEIQKIRNERLRLIRKENKIIKKYYDIGKNFPIDKTKVGRY